MKLRAYWQQFWSENSWEDREVEDKKNELVGILKPKIKDAYKGNSRANVSLSLSDEDHIGQRLSRN